VPIFVKFALPKRPSKSPLYLPLCLHPQTCKVGLPALLCATKTNLPPPLPPPAAAPPSPLSPLSAYTCSGQWFAVSPSAADNTCATPMLSSAGVRSCTFVLVKQVKRVTRAFVASLSARGAGWLVAEDVARAVASLSPPACAQTLKPCVSACAATRHAPES
jgi:hypothetical protein